MADYRTEPHPAPQPPAHVPHPLPHEVPPQGHPPEHRQVPQQRTYPNPNAYQHQPPVIIAPREPYYNNPGTYYSPPAPQYIDPITILQEQANRALQGCELANEGRVDPFRAERFAERVETDAERFGRPDIADQVAQACAPLTNVNPGYDDQVLPPRRGPLPERVPAPGGPGSWLDR